MRRSKKKSNNSKVKIFSNNVAGLKRKIQSLKSQLTETNAAIFTLQETHSSRKGKIKVDEFQVYEAIRQNKKDGGTAIGVHKSLNPFVIKVYEDDFELLVVEAVIEGTNVRIISGYGPQESWAESERLPFFVALEEEILKSRLSGKPVIVQLDANSKLGPQLIKNDPHEQSPNGSILAGILERQHLVLVNGLGEKCKGLITRKRTTVKAVEKSIIDFMIVSDEVADVLD